MEFSYKISEAEYFQAWKVWNERRTEYRLVGCLIYLWIFVLVCFVLFWGLVSLFARPSSARIHWAVFLPFIAIAGCLVFAFVGIVPMRVRHSYRKDHAMQRQFTASVTPGSIIVHNANGISTQAGGDIYEYWINAKDLIVLGLRSGAYSIVSLAGLTEPQRGELRGILTSTLPKK